jgi:hypothetical protein
LGWPALRRAVAARVGYDPFFTWAPKTVVVHIAAAPPHGFVARLLLVDDRGVAFGARELRTQGQCIELLDAAALGIAIAIDPRSLSAPILEPPPSEPSGARPADSVPGSPVPPPPADPYPTRPAIVVTVTPPPSRLRLDVEAGPAVSLGVAPKPAVGLIVGAAARFRAASLGIDARVDGPAGEALANPKASGVSESMASTTVRVCAHTGALSACGLGQAGVLLARSDGVPDRQSRTAPWWAAGVRLGSERAITQSLAVALYADWVVNLHPLALEFAGRTVSTPPPIAATFAACAMWRFP